MRRFFFAAIFFPLIFSCKNKNAATLVLWTDCVELVSYAELFNSLQDEAKVAVHFFEAAEDAFPPKKGEQNPDIVCGTFLQSKEKYFSSLNSLLKILPQRENFYPPLLKYGRKKNRQYLLPVSFNLPALVFHSRDYDFASQNVFSFEDAKRAARAFDLKNAGAMAFGVSWNENFLHLVLKTAGVRYEEKNGELFCNEDAFSEGLRFAREWSGDLNGGFENESDFAFKYLYMPFFGQTQSDRCLFTFSSSEKIMSLSESQLSEIDFRWICNDKKIQIEDEVVMIGISAKSKNKFFSKKFLAWLLTEDSQKKILERKFQMKLRSQTFGIAGGFSSIKSVNQKIFPLYYRPLVTALPINEELCAPQIFPENWSEIKEQVVLPFIKEQTQNAKENSLSARYAEYVLQKQAEEN